MPEISIIIVNFNTRKLVEDCINSIKKNTKLNYEIIVIDNGSDEKLNKSKDYILVENEKNLGFAKANNQGIKIAKGKYILLLNSDTVVKKDLIDKLYEFAKEKSDAGVVAPKLLNKDGSVQDSVFHFPTITNAIKEFWLGEKNLFGLYAPKVDEVTQVDAVVGAAFLITPIALEKIGKLNEKYFFYYEDLDYCREVWKNGLKVYYLPQAKIIHLKGASGKNIATDDNQWKRLIPSSKIYNGLVKYYILFFIMWVGQRLRK